MQHPMLVPATLLALIAASLTNAAPLGSPDFASLLYPRQDGSSSSSSSSSTTTSDCGLLELGCTLFGGSGAAAGSGDSTSTSTSECNLIQCTSGSSGSSEGNSSSSSSSSSIVNVGGN